MTPSMKQFRSAAKKKFPKNKRSVVQGGDSVDDNETWDNSLPRKSSDRSDFTRNKIRSTKKSHKSPGSPERLGSRRDDR